MTIQRAIEIIKKALEIIKSQMPHESAVINEVIKTVEVVAEKQTPKKPIKELNEVICPNCKTLVGSSPFCRYCGQALDWNDLKGETK